MLITFYGSLKDDKLWNVSGQIKKKLVETHGI